jgi:hypothetical protein
MTEDEHRHWIIQAFDSGLTTMVRNVRRLTQCMTCRHDPEECGCDDSDEDENGMCKKWMRR